MIIYSYHGIKIFFDFIKVDMVVVLGEVMIYRRLWVERSIKNAIRFNLIKKTGLKLVMLDRLWDLIIPLENPL